MSVHSIAPQQAIDAAATAMAPHLSEEEGHKATQLAEIALRIGMKEIALIRARSRKNGLTERQKECLGVIRKYIKDHDGVSPTFAEIGSGLGVERANVFYFVHKLEERGYITMMPNKERSISLT